MVSMKRRLQNRYTAQNDDADLYAPNIVDLVGGRSSSQNGVEGVSDSANYKVLLKI